MKAAAKSSEEPVVSEQEGSARDIALISTSSCFYEGPWQSAGRDPSFLQLLAIASTSVILS